MNTEMTEMTWIEAMNFLEIFKSVDSQLEFLTLTGIIFAGMMQGYICINSIYVFLIENIENEPLDFTHSAYASENKVEDATAKNKVEATEKLTQAVNKA